MQNRINVSLEEETKQIILQKLAEVKGLMPFLIKLSDTERKSLQMMDDGRKRFTEKALDYGGRNEDVNPGGALLEAAAVDMDLNTALRTFESELAQLYEGVHDNRMLPVPKCTKLPALCI